MIDLKHGLPIINQVYDSLYEIGKDCSKRIILFSDGLNEFDKNIPAADYWVVNSLIHNLRQYPLGIHFYKMDKDTFSIRSAYTVQNWEPIEDWPISKIPTREQFMAETFWRVYFDSFNEEFYESCKTFSSGFRNISDWGHIIYIDCSFLGEIQLYWDQKGVRYLIKQDNDSG